MLNVIAKTSLIFLGYTLFLPTTLVSANQDIKNQLDAYNESYLEEYQVPGVSVAIVHNNEIHYLKSWGITGESERKVTTETPFKIDAISFGDKDNI